MRSYWVTVCHAPARVLAASAQQVRNTLLPEELESFHETVFVDNRYPLNRVINSEAVQATADTRKAHVIRPPKNVGGHGGVSYALKFLNGFTGGLKDDDLIFVVDPDSHPRTGGWVTAMQKVFAADKSVGVCALSFDFMDEGSRPWNNAAVWNGPSYRWLTFPEMSNVAAYKYAVLKEGMQADRQFYGFVETAMHRHMKKLDLKAVYLTSFFEDLNPVPQDPEYNDWKRQHAGGIFLGNFDEFIGCPS